jgi:formamidopyrimidine-DNA glycosylase
MPELPEVETIRMGLSTLLPGRQIVRVESDNPKSFPNAPDDVSQFVVGATVVSVARRAKVLLIALSSKYSLVIHLKMTGQLVFRGEQSFGAGHPTDSLIGELPDRSTRVTITFADGSTLFFNDQRKFGWVKLVPTDAVQELPFFQKLGPEPLESTFSFEIFHERLMRRKNTTIKAALLDQSVLAGVGNIYADESLWAAKIHPLTRVKDVPIEALRKLHQEIIAVLRLSIEKGGSTNKNYVNAEGKKGSYMSFAKVFRREGQPCVRCGTTILKIKVAGRGTHICENCQKSPK